jgi:hypothetical protein
MVENRSIARAAGIVGIVGHLAAVLLYVILPGLEVSYPALYAFQAAWLIVLAASIWWLRAHPWRSAVVPLIGVFVASVARILGEQSLGWRG